MAFEKGQPGGPGRPPKPRRAHHAHIRITRADIAAAKDGAVLLRLMAPGGVNPVRLTDAARAIERLTTQWTARRSTRMEREGRELVAPRRRTGVAEAAPPADLHATTASPLDLAPDEYHDPDPDALLCDEFDL